jgi:hypothetical protein
VIAVEKCADVDAHDVPGLQDPIPGNPVDDLLVHGDASARGISIVPLERRNGTLRANVLFDCIIDLTRSDAGRNHPFRQVETRADDGRAPGDFLDLDRLANVDQTDSSTPSSDR